jgi:hypothetical protein
VVPWAASVAASVADWAASAAVVSVARNRRCEKLRGGGRQRGAAWLRVRGNAS